MSLRRIAASPDLVRLQDEGYHLELRPRHLLIHEVPYVDSQRRLCRGTLVVEVNLSGDVTGAPSNHVAYFIGGYPCDRDGKEISQIRHPSSGRQELGSGLVVDCSFSAKPTDGPYADYYQKVIRYVSMISGPARAIDPTSTAQSYAPIETTADDGVFLYVDTASSRAGITAVMTKLDIGKVGIVGVGGTGSYVLDLVAKTPVKEIHLFDGDGFLNHNAFRAPGAASLEELRAKPKKVHYLAALYGRMRRGIVPHPEPITVGNVEALRGMDFVFLCMDGGPDKQMVVARLQEWGVDFIDVGMGLVLTEGAIGGILTVTCSTHDKHNHVTGRVSRADADAPNDYARNIQVADLNALNACLAVIKWKKRLGFYRDFVHEHYTTYTLDGNRLINEDEAGGPK